MVSQKLGVSAEEAVGRKLAFDKVKSKPKPHFSVREKISFIV